MISSLRNGEDYPNKEVVYTIILHPCNKEDKDKEGYLF
jgi:hypothetical protein